MYFATSTNQDCFSFCFCRAKYISAFVCVFMNNFCIVVEYRQFLTAQEQAGRLFEVEASLLPSSCGFQSVSRTNYANIGNQTQAHSSFDRLVSRTIFAQCNAVVSENVNYALTHQCRHTDCRTEEVSEYEEGAAERNEAAVESNTVHYNAHSMFAYTVMDVAASSIFFGEEAFSVDDGFVGRTKVSTTAYQFRQLHSQFLDDFAGSFASCSFCSFFEDSFQGFQVNHEFIINAVVQFLRKFRICYCISFEFVVPSFLSCCASRKFSCKTSCNFFGNIEHFFRIPTSIFFSSFQCISTEGFAVARSFILFGAAITDVGANDNQRRMFGICLSFFNSSFHSFNIFRISYAQYLPTISFEAHFNIFAECNISATFDGDFVVVI